MDYLKIYNNLCETRKHMREAKKTTGFELHHIIPRCLNGKDSKENYVSFTYREHYVAHWLLTKIYPDNPKIHYGFFCMLRDPHGLRPLTSRMVETIKKNYSEFKKWHLKINNPGRSEKSRASAKKRMTERNPNQGGATNPTAYPVEITFFDGTKQRFEYMKLAADTLKVPYSSMKAAQRTGGKLKRYKIEKVCKIVL